MGRFVVLVEVLDDTTGESGASAVRLSLDKVEYEIDLTEANATQLREALAPWIGAARRISSPSGRPYTSTRRDPAQTAAIRAWALSNGHKISTKGKIPATVLRAYEQAHTAS